MGKRVLVTGGAGFIGSHVCASFQKSGWEVEALDDLSTGKTDNVPPGVRLHRVDVCSSDAALLVREGAYEVVIHLAAQMDVRKSVADPLFDARTNIVGTLNIAEAVRASARRARLVFSSTGGVLYGEFVTPPNVETYPKDPESPYAIAKLSAEYYLAYYGRVHAVDAVSLRFGNVYGPRQDPHGEAGVVAIFCGRILEGKPITVFGDGQQTRDYVFVGDVARATFLAATATLPRVERVDSRSFNIGTGIGTTVNHIAATLFRVSDRRVPIEFAPARAGEQQHSFVDVSKAGSLLHWRPETTLEEGLRETFPGFAARAARGAAQTTR